MGSLAERAVERSVAAAKNRSRNDVELLLAACLKVLQRKGAPEMTISDVLSEAGLSTRAFYRHFQSKSELLLALYEHEINLYVPRLRERLDAADSPKAALVAWIDELLAAATAPRRGDRTRAMFNWAIPLQREFPAEFAAIRAALTDPLEAVLAAGLADGTFPLTRPARDAHFIRAVAWEVIDERFPSASIDVTNGRDEVLRFVLPALGAS